MDMTSFNLIAVIVAFLAGCLIAGGLVALLFFVRRRKGLANSGEKPVTNSNVGNRVSIRHCPQCDSTYTDEDQLYCLRDGTPLKVVGSMPRPDDEEETVVINRSR